MSMSLGSAHSHDTTGQILAAVRKYWGFETLRPLQAEAIGAGLAKRDSLVVMPTGGGKSLCYQVPPVVGCRTDIVVSPLISLMKDQVDGLQAAGYPCAALNSSLSAQTQRHIEQRMLDGELRLVFVAPERLVTSPFMQLLERANTQSFAIDEAHCISHWGHDFRKEYRQLATLRQRFPHASLHAFTATATRLVRDDIVAQLGLTNPTVLVGTFDRPNLIYRVVPLQDAHEQALAIVRRHDREAAIVYCLSRKDAESMAMFLQANGVRAAHYHAGMDAEDRRRTQERFAQEELDVIAATVAFGMGIDRSNVRCVIHASMPKSIEHYQQETGRAGRDGLEAECVLLYGVKDVIRWEGLISKSAANAEQPEDVIAAAIDLLGQMKRYCSSMKCRHRSLSEYFGQAYEQPSCGACDICLGESEGLVNATVTAQKILSCVARVEQRFGIGHVVDVLAGANTEQVRRCGHDSLSTWGILKDMESSRISSLVYQLVDQGVLDRTSGDRPVLKLNERSLDILKGTRTVMIMEAPSGRVRKSRVAADAWEGVDRDLFERLRQLRAKLAAERSVPAFVIFADTTLRELARVRPTSTHNLKRITGIGEKKLREFGALLIELIAEASRSGSLATDQLAAADIVVPRKAKSNQVKDEAFGMFASGATIDDVAARLHRARSTVLDYLSEFVATHRPRSLAPWVEQGTYDAIADAAAKFEDGRLKPIFDHLGGSVDYGTIRIVLAHLA